jgi:cytidine deaminase
MPTLQETDRSGSAADRTPSKEELVEAAAAAAKNAYAPYSNLCVGSALLSERGNIYSGCNVENISFSLVSCAERNAIAAAVRAEGASFKLKAIAVATQSGLQTPISPCGACRQAIREFSSDARVAYVGPDGNILERPISELLPDSFSSLM